MTPGATTVDVAGRPVVLSYTNVGAEYDALRRRAIVVDRSHRGRIRFTGAKAAEVLDGLLTNDVGALHASQGQYAFALSPKGKVIADMRVLRDGVDFVTDASPRSRDGWAATVKKYVNPRLSKYVDESETTRALGVYGVQARHVVEHMTGISAAALGIMPSFAHASASREGARVLVMRSPDLGIEGFDLIVAADGFDSLWSAATHARATPAGQSAWEIARVEAGRPEWGVDMDDSTIPQEANVDALDAVSYTKGCYTGQEVVARVHFRGHVNRALRGLTFAGALPAGRASLFDASDKAVGEVTSAVASPRLGAIALAMVRREVADGTTLAARWPADVAGDAAAGEAQATVVALPFAS